MPKDYVMLRGEPGDVAHPERSWAYAIFRGKDKKVIEIISNTSLGKMSVFVTVEEIRKLVAWLDECEASGETGV